LESCVTRADEIARQTVQNYGPKPTNPNDASTLDYKLADLAIGLMEGTSIYGRPDYDGLKRLLSYECRYQIDSGQH